MTDSQIKMIYAYMVKSVYIYAHVNFCLVGVCECGPGDILILWFESVAIKLCTSMLVTHRDELSLVLRLSKPLLCTFHWCGRNGYPKGDHLQFDIFFILGVYVYS